MKATRNSLAALAGAVALAVSIPVLAQGMDHPMNQPGARPDGDRGSMDNRDMHHDDGRMMGHHRHRDCHWVWRHHRRVRVCNWR